jgi:hypothetical protein
MRGEKKVRCTRRYSFSISARRDGCSMSRSSLGASSNAD